MHMLCLREEHGNCGPIYGQLAKLLIACLPLIWVSHLPDTHYSRSADSVSPSVIVQRKDGFSDIWMMKEDVDGAWKDYLADSTMERIRLLEEIEREDVGKQ